jgi:putative DNA methylase
VTTAQIRKKLIEVSIPLEAINAASAREKSIRHGHPSTLHLWWARRPLAACRAVLFAQLVDDPSAWPDRFPTEEAQDAERRRLHKVIERMVPWEASNDEAILNEARWEIARSVAWGLGKEPPAKGDGSAILDYLQTKAPPVYDPFCGGGSIPLEAQRLGLRAYGSDLNPVAVLISKALVEIPPKFAGLPPVNKKSQAELKRGGKWNGKGAQGLAEDVRYYGQWMRDEAEKRIGHLYPKATLSDGTDATVIAWLWARTVRSPDPAAKGAMVPLVSSFLLSTKEGKKAWVEPVIDSTAQDGWRFEVRTGRLSKADEERLKEGTIGRSTGGFCVISGASMPFSYVREQGQTHGLGVRLMAVVAEGGRQRIYLSPTDEQAETAANITPTWEPEGELPNNPRDFKTPNYGMSTFASLFTTRQLVALTTFSDLVGEARERVRADAEVAGFSRDSTPLHAGGTGAIGYADAVATYLAFAVSKSSTRSCSVAIWETGMGRLAGALGRQAIQMQWSFAETNPIAGAGGDIAGTAVSVAENLHNLGTAGPGSVRNVVAQHNSFEPSPIVISTDPPYYDNIGYADLSDFFYVWLRRSLLSIWPYLFRRLTTPKTEELVATPYRFGDDVGIPTWVGEIPGLAGRWTAMSSKDRAEAFFMHGMSYALRAMRNAAENATPLAIYYAFRQSEAAEDGVTSAGWASFLQAVVDAGLAVDGTWPIRTEATNALKANMNALASSIVLVCRKRTVNAPVVTRAEFIRALKREMPDAIDDIRKAGVGPVDMQQSVIGPGMGVFTRYAKVLESDDSAMTVKTALGLINGAWEEIENELDANFDPETQVALAWYASYGFEAKKSGELIVVANAKNVPEKSLFESRVFDNLHGNAALTKREALPLNWSPRTDPHITVWRCVQQVARVLKAEEGGGDAAAKLVAQMGPLAADAQKLAYRLFEIATHRKLNDEALVYNELAQEWAKLEDLAASSAPAAPREEAQPSFQF